MTIGVTELMWQAQRIESETFRGVETMTAVTIIYFVLSCGIIAMFRGLEHLVRIPGTR
jgi:ABC-type amino acid transport system permease subunit